MAGVPLAMSDDTLPESGADEIEVAVRSLPEEERHALERARKVSDLLDEAVTVPGTDYQIGLDPILGVLPISGDAVSAVISLYIVAEAARAGVSLSTLAVMVALVGVDAVVGSVPILGTVFDAVWKANTWNVNLLERELANR